FAPFRTPVQDNSSADPCAREHCQTLPDGNNQPTRFPRQLAPFCFREKTQKVELSPSGERFGVTFLNRLTPRMVPIIFRTLPFWPILASEAENVFLLALLAATRRPAAPFKKEHTARDRKIGGARTA